MKQSSTVGIPNVMVTYYGKNSRIPHQGMMQVVSLVTEPIKAEFSVL